LGEGVAKGKSGSIEGLAGDESCSVWLQATLKQPKTLKQPNKSSAHRSGRALTLICDVPNNL